MQEIGKQQSLQRDSWWSEEPVVHIVRKSENAGAGNWTAHWTPNDFDTYDNAKVQVYSNCDEVELFLNDKSLGLLKNLLTIRQENGMSLLKKER